MLSLRLQPVADRIAEMRVLAEQQRLVIKGKDGKTAAASLVLHAARACLAVRLPESLEVSLGTGSRGEPCLSNATLYQRLLGQLDVSNVPQSLHRLT